MYDYDDPVIYYVIYLKMEDRLGKLDKCREVGKIHIEGKIHPHGPYGPRGNQPW